MIIGAPKEISVNENRVALTPQTTGRLIKKGYQVIIEKGAGSSANYDDEAYIVAGASLVESAASIYTKADIVFKVLPPSPSEVSMMKSGQILFSYLSPATNPDLLSNLASQGVKAVAMDAIPRISRAQKMDVLSSMANIAGYRAVIEGVNHFGRFLNGQITAAGKVEPAKVLVIGAGVAGLAAIGTAKSLGAIVRAFDTRKEVEEQIQSMGAKFLTVNIEEDGSTSSGYSKVMSKEFIEAEMALFLEQAKEIDMIITTALIPGREAPKLILDYHVAAMKPGSVIVDLAALAGGNCVHTKKDEIITTDNGVTIIGKLDQMPTQASQLYSSNLCNLLDDMGNADNFQINYNDDIISRAMVTREGSVFWPPAPLPVSGSGPKPTKTEVKSAKTNGHSNKSATSHTKPLITLAIIGLIIYGLSIVAPPSFTSHFTVFVLAIFVGWQVIWNVSHSLHTPLMAVTNAISGIIIIGGLLQVKADLHNPLTIIAVIAILVASINIVGGFVVTHRMLKMFRK